MSLDRLEAAQHTTQLCLRLTSASLGHQLASVT